MAFTLPSALLMVLFAFGAVLLEGPVGEGLIHGLKLVAVAVVAHAVWGMAQSLCPDRERAGIALAGVIAVVAIGGPLSPLVAIVLGALAGLVLCRRDDESTADVQAVPVSRSGGHVALGLFLALLAGLPLATWLFPQPTIQLADAFYRSGALVFGGGHVVLPLLEAEVVQSGWVSHDDFLSGYGAAQALPGPLFTFAAYLGARDRAGRWRHGRRRPGAGHDLPARPPAAGRRSAALEPLSPPTLRPKRPCAVPTLPLSAFSAPHSTTRYGPARSPEPAEFALALTGFVLLAAWQLPSWSVVLILAASGVVMGPWII
ncbi:MAG: chromate transporter [Xanthomonadales bacterium]|nr:chromate transporter [Xanthomonadales bacterium]